MKKIMFAAAAVALVGGVFAADVYDYKASVKYVDFKKVKINKVSYNVKVVKSTSLSGYLVTPIQCPCTQATGVTGLDPAFLIVVNKNSSGKMKITGVKDPKVLPANLLTKVWAINASKTLEAQGYLFAGVMDQGSANFVAPASTAYDFGDNTTKETQYLWSIWNDEDPGSGAFVETWLTHAGFGKGTADPAKDAGCRKGSAHECLVSLAGSVVGGAFTCEPSEYLWTGGNPPTLSEVFLCQGWNETTGDQVYLMDVVSGTWSIKGNTKLKGVPLSTTGAIESTIPAVMTAADADKELMLLKAAGQKLYKDYTLDLVDPAFAAKWF